MIAICAVEFFKFYDEDFDALGWFCLLSERPRDYRQDARQTVSVLLEVRQMDLRNGFKFTDSVQTGTGSFFCMVLI